MGMESRFSHPGLQFQSEVQFCNLNPEFEFTCEIPVEDPRGQRVTVSVWDQVSDKL